MDKWVDHSKEKTRCSELPTRRSDDEDLGCGETQSEWPWDPGEVADLDWLHPH